jgi:hypothetical protein
MVGLAYFLLLVPFGVGPFVLTAIGKRLGKPRIWVSGLLALLFAFVSLIAENNPDDFSPQLEAALALAALIEVGNGIREWSDHW